MEVTNQDSGEVIEVPYAEVIDMARDLSASYIIGYRDATVRTTLILGVGLAVGIGVVWGITSAYRKDQQRKYIVPKHTHTAHRVDKNTIVLDSNGDDQK